MSKESVIFDVGANVGDWTVAAAEGMGSHMKIYAFEPSKYAFGKLQKSLSRCYDSRIKAINVALSDRNGEAALYMTGPLDGTNSLHKRRAEVLGVWQKQQEQVLLQRGDDFCQKECIEHIDFLKIDTEGHEMAVLRGFEGMLSKGRISYIQFEYGGAWIDSRKFLLEAFDLLLPKDYKIGRIHPKGIELFDAYDQRQETFRYANYLAVQAECMEGLKRIGQY